GADVRSCGSGVRAFTLVEVVTVLVIVGLVSAIGTVRYSSSLNRYRAEGAGRLIIAEVDRAKILARTTGSAHTVRFAPGSASLAVLSAEDVLSSRPGRVVSIGGAPYHATIAVSGMAGNAVMFDAYGEPNGGGVVTISSGGLTSAVIIDPASGRAYALSSN
ncbi:MAG: prepilin-type N-terminal cleavage/methylation domain-containing protein, partial [Phycisphaerales bacterium]